MTPESAEMTKYVANCLLATKISFINEMANLCEAYGADVNDVRRGIGHDQRIGFQLPLHPGVGYGGSLLPQGHPRRRSTWRRRKGPAEPQHDGGRRHGQRGAEGQSCSARSADALQRRPRRGRRSRSGAWPSSPRPTTSARPRRSSLIDSLLKAAGAHGPRVHDPEAIPNVRELYGDRITYCDRPYGALEQADALAIVTEWNEFRNPDFEVMGRLMRAKVVFDGRNLYEPDAMAALGFAYQGIGRPVSPAGKA